LNMKQALVIYVSIVVSFHLQHHCCIKSTFHLWQTHTHTHTQTHTHLVAGGSLAATVAVLQVKATRLISATQWQCVMVCGVHQMAPQYTRQCCISTTSLSHSLSLSLSLSLVVRNVQHNLCFSPIPLQSPGSRVSEFLMKNCQGVICLMRFIKQAAVGICLVETLIHSSIVPYTS